MFELNNVKYFERALVTSSYPQILQTACEIGMSNLISFYFETYQWEIFYSNISHAP